MAYYREIVTKAVIGKGKKNFSNHYTIAPENIPSTILGCWVINHNFNGTKLKDEVIIKGTYDINIWYSYDNDSKTYVAKDTINYDEKVKVDKKRESDTSTDEIIVRCLSGPTCTKVEIKDGHIEYDIEKELGIEIVGDTKMRISVDDTEDDWDDLNNLDEKNKIDNVNEDFISYENKSN